MAYTKQNFEKGQVLTAEHLNHMEDGIAAPDWSDIKNKPATYGATWDSISGKPGMYMQYGVMLMDDMICDFSDAVDTSCMFQCTLDTQLEVDNLYRIIWDGQEYLLRSMLAADGTIYIGNASLTEIGDDTGEPFIVFNTGEEYGSVRFVTTVGELPYRRITMRCFGPAIYRTDGAVESDIEYTAIEGTQGVTWIHLTEQQDPGLGTGVTVVVNGGTPQAAIVVKDSDGAIFAGSRNELDVISGKAPFGYYPYRGEMFIAGNVSSAFVEIYLTPPAPATIPEEYIPEQIMTSPDWNSPHYESGHIKNRTHYDDRTTADLNITWNALDEIFFAAGLPNDRPYFTPSDGNGERYYKVSDLLPSANFTGTISIYRMNQTTGSTSIPKMTVRDDGILKFGNYFYVLPDGIDVNGDPIEPGLYVYYKDKSASTTDMWYVQGINATNVQVGILKTLDEKFLPEKTDGTEISVESYTSSSKSTNTGTVYTGTLTLVKDECHFKTGDILDVTFVNIANSQLYGILKYTFVIQAISASAWYGYAASQFPESIPSEYGIADSSSRRVRYTASTAPYAFLRGNVIYLCTRDGAHQESHVSALSVVSVRHHPL